MLRQAWSIRFHQILNSGNFHDCDLPTLDALNERVADLQARQSRLKRGSHQWRKRQQQIRNARRDIGNIKDNWEHHTAKAIAVANDTVIVEKLRHNNMRRSTRGTSENPGKNAAAKRGLNRSLANARPGAMQQNMARHCRKSGSNCLEVDPAGTGITCYGCGHRDRKNRKTQGLFLCQGCHAQANADENAARNIRRKGMQLITLYLLVQIWKCIPHPKYRRVGIPSLGDSQRSVLTALGGLWHFRRQGKLNVRHAPQLAHAVTPQQAAITRG